MGQTLSIRDRLADVGIKKIRSGENKVLCPECSHNRRHKQDRCLSVTVSEDKAVWFCHNCGWKGGFSDEFQRDKPRDYRKMARAVRTRRLSG